jgi:uncharacterized DUF497 family protein
VIFEWDARKAAANLEKHHLSFEDAATVFLDPLAITFADPDHSADERREITVGHTIKRELVFVSHCERGERVRIIGARRATRTERRQSEDNMKKESAHKGSNRLRDEYDLSRLKGGVRGKYYSRASAGTNLVLIEPDLARLFPDSESVNRALRMLAQTARAVTASKRRRSG